MLIRTDKDLINMDNVERIIIDVNIKGTSATVEANYNNDYATIAAFESAETINCTDCANELIDLIMDAYERGARVLDLRTVKM